MCASTINPRNPYLGLVCASTIAPPPPYLGLANVQPQEGQHAAGPLLCLVLTTLEAPAGQALGGGLSYGQPHVHGVLPWGQGGRGVGG